MSNTKDFSRFTARRTELLKQVKEHYPDTTDGLVILFAGFETGSQPFRQNSTFYYYTGLTEPGLVITMELTGATTLWIPAYKSDRSVWMHSELDLDQAQAQQLGVKHVSTLGAPVEGFEIKAYAPLDSYTHLLQTISGVLKSSGTLFASSSPQPGHDVDQRFMLERFEKKVGPQLTEHLVDISPLIAQMRRTKDNHEIELLYKAIDVTCVAQEVAARSIVPKSSESEVQARLEYIFTASRARRAFATIVASGKNSTTLHYHANNQELNSGDLVVVDAGAEYGYYCGDISRTYPVSGTFNKRQKEIYNLVLETQEYIAKLAQPGYWLSNKEHPDKSLNHLAHKYLEDKGYGKYFTHGVGHYLGLDTHDVGDYAQPLHIGDVFTIEPGIYIPEEKIGVRIEDDYWMTKAGVICLSEQLPKSAEEVEQLVQHSFGDKE